MFLAIVLAAIGVGLVALGIKGFSEEGIPFSAEKTLKGQTGRVVGIVCIVIGAPLALAGFWIMVKLAGMK